MKYPKRCQYKHAKQKKYHVRNWAEYNEGLRRRGDLTVWFDEESLVPPTLAKPCQPRGKSHPSLQCHNWPDWVADGAVWSYPVSAGNHQEQGKTGN